MSFEESWFQPVISGLFESNKISCLQNSLGLLDDPPWQWQEVSSFTDVYDAALFCMVAWWPGGLVDLLGHRLAFVHQEVHQAAFDGGADFGFGGASHDWTGIRSQLIHLSLPRRQPTCLALASFPLNHFVHLFATRYLKHRTTRIKNFKTRLELVFLTISDFNKRLLMTSCKLFTMLKFTSIFGAEKPQPVLN